MSEQDAGGPAFARTRFTNPDGVFIYEQDGMTLRGEGDADVARGVPRLGNGVGERIRHCRRHAESEETMKPILTIDVMCDGGAVINTNRLSGEQLLDAAAYAIAGAVRMVEATWATAYGKASGVNASQCAINRAAKMLLSAKAK